MTATQTNTPEDALAHNLWQLEEERIGRERRISLRDQPLLQKARAGWWKTPLAWAVLFCGVFMARDAFAALLVEIIFKAGL